MSDVTILDAQDQESGVMVSSTGEFLPVLDTDNSTQPQITHWIRSAWNAVEYMEEVDELDQADAMLAAVIKRLGQIGENKAEAERLRIWIYKRRGDLLGPAQFGQNNPTGSNQFTPEDKSSREDLSSPKPKQERQRDWQSRKISENWDRIESITEDMKKPSINAAMREIKRLDSKLETPPDGGEAIITHSRWEDWLPQQPECDLLFTDPPYATDVDDIYKFASHWLPYGLAKVKSTGRAYVCVGAYPNELEAYLTVPTPDHLIMSQVLVWTYRNTLGPTPKHDYKLNWQAILYYRGVDADPLDSPEMVEQFSVQDINAPDGRQGDRWHAWQKPDALADRFIRHSTKPGDIVLDPFAGTGTHLLAAARLGRKGYGCDATEETYKIAIERGCQNAD